MGAGRMRPTAGGVGPPVTLTNWARLTSVTRSDEVLQALLARRGGRKHCQRYSCRCAPVRGGSHGPITRVLHCDHEWTGEEVDIGVGVIYSPCHDCGMTKEEHRSVDCQKDAYSSETEARAHGIMRGQRLRSYQCNFCRLWHLTRRLVV